MTVKLLTEHHLEFLNLKRGCTGSYESTLVKVPHCWLSQVETHICLAGQGITFKIQSETHFKKKIRMSVPDRTFLHANYRAVQDVACHCFEVTIHQKLFLHSPELIRFFEVSMRRVAN